MRLLARPLLVTAALFGAACGPAPDVEEAPSRGLAEGDEVPATDRDPIPFTPTPSGPGMTGATVALAASGGEDQARRMLPDLLRAMRDADERGLEQLLADELSAVNSNRGPSNTRPRASWVERIMAYARRAAIPGDARIEELVDLETLEISRAVQFWRNREMPENVRPTDLVVEVQLLEPARGPLRSMLGWHLRGTVVVRPGRDPRIVAL